MTEYVKKSDVLTQLYLADAITVHGLEILNAMPAEDVVPRKEEKAEDGEKMGKWIQHEGYEGSPWYFFECSACHEKSWRKHSYCPNCGARMVEQ